jgi:hypothetical protein
MKLFLPFIALVFSSCMLESQPFEGKIIYKASYKSNSLEVSSEQWAEMMGTRQEYFIKGGNYKSTFDGTFLQWQLYINKDNKSYGKMANAAEVVWSDAGVNTDSVLSVQLNKNVDTVLGYPCDEVILTCKSGVQKYYFNSTLKVDAAIYEKHIYGNWYAYLKEAQAVPLKIVISNEEFTMESTAVEVKAMALSDSDFELPANVITIKNPY